MNTPVRVGGEFLVNTTTFGSQAGPATTVLADGSFVVVWTDTGENGDDVAGHAIRGQRFSKTGEKLGAEFLVNTTTSGNQSGPTITALSTGGFVIAWQDFSMTGGDTSSIAVRAQVFSWIGEKAGPEFLVNTTTESSQNGPTIGTLSDGRFVVVWTDGSQSGGDTSLGAIRAQIFSENGHKEGSEFLVNTTVMQSQGDPEITALSDGRFVVAWTDSSQTGDDTSLSAIRAQVFSGDGTKQGTEFLVNTTTQSTQWLPTITGLPEGRFVVAWSDRSQTGDDTSDYAVRAQVFSANGTRFGHEILVNTATQNDQWLPSVTALSDGRFVVVWADASAARYDPVRDIRAQVFNTTGDKVGEEFLINTTTESEQRNPSVTALSGGRFVVSWEDFSQTGDDTSGQAIRAQIFDAGGAVNTPPEVVSVPQPGLIAQGAAVSLDLAAFFADADGDALVFTATGLPPGLQIDPETGVISGTVPFIVNNGTFAVQVEVSDGRGGTATVSFDWAVYNDAPPYSATEIFAEHGKLGFLALMSKAAYHLRADEPGAARYNTRADGADAAYATVAGDLALLHDGVLDGIGQSIDGRWVNRIGGPDAGAGLFTNRNGAALVGQAEDALFVAFRGTNNAVSLTENGEIDIAGHDMAHWLNRPAHFRLFAGLLDDIRNHVLEQDGAISTIYITGHSLGASMVQPAVHWLQRQLPGVKVEGVTFASPGFRLGYDKASPDITNFWNAMDAIRLPEAISTVAGEGFVFNNAVRNLFDGFTPLSAHSMDYYLEIARFFKVEEGRVNTTLIRQGLDIPDLLTMNKDRISFGTERLDDGSVVIGGGRDFVLAGVLEAAIGVVSDVVSEVVTSWKTPLAVMKATRDFGAAVTEFSAQSGYDAAKGGTGLLADAFEDTSKSLYGQVKKASLLLFIGEAVINAIDELIASDLVLGGDGSDVLYGLAGHDILIGGRGDDHLFGGRGVDVLYGGAGNDMLHAGSGGFDDDLIGGQGNDQYWVARSTDRVTDFASDEGIDVVTTEVSYDLNNLLAGGVEHLIGIGRRHIDLTANDLDNLVLGNLAHNRITGHAGDDTLSGLTGKDTVSGGTGHDVLLGGDHRDTLGGGAGNDTLDGGAGADVLTGGSDADVFLFASSAEADGDRITDFVQGVDRIDLGRIWSEVYPDGQGDGPAGLEFTGTTRSTEEGTVHYRQKTGLISGEQTTEIRINIDGGLLSEAKIILDGHYVLLADDFYLFWGL